MRRRLTALLAGLTLAVALGACSSEDPEAPDVGSTPTATGNSPGVNGTPAPTGATTPVDPPAGSGNISATAEVPEAPAATMDEEIGATPEVQEGVGVTISGVAAITAEAGGPGEVAGPAIAVTIAVFNTTDEPFDLSMVSVNLEDAAGLPGSGMSAAPADWLTGTCPPGESVQGVYVFTVPQENRSPVHVEVSVDPTLPTVVFTGDV